MRCEWCFVILSSLSLNRDSPWTRNITTRQKKDKTISLFCLKFPQRQKSAESLKRFWNRSIHLFHHKLRSIVKTFRLPRLLLHKWPWPRRNVYVPVVPATLWFFRICQNFLTSFKRVSTYFSQDSFKLYQRLSHCSGPCIKQTFFINYETRNATFFFLFFFFILWNLLYTFIFWNLLHTRIARAWCVSKSLRLDHICECRSYLVWVVSKILCHDVDSHNVLSKFLTSWVLLVQSSWVNGYTRGTFFCS